MLPDFVGLPQPDMSVSKVYSVGTRSRKNRSPNNQALKPENTSDRHSGARPGAPRQENANISIVNANLARSLQTGAGGAADIVASVRASLSSLPQIRNAGPDTPWSSRMLPLLKEAGASPNFLGSGKGKAKNTAPHIVTGIDRKRIASDKISFDALDAYNKDNFKDRSREAEYACSNAMRESLDKFCAALEECRGLKKNAQSIQLLNSILDTGARLMSRAAGFHEKLSRYLARPFDVAAKLPGQVGAIAFGKLATDANRERGMQIARTLWACDAYLNKYHLTSLYTNLDRKSALFCAARNIVHTAVGAATKIEISVGTTDGRIRSQLGAPISTGVKRGLDGGKSFRESLLMTDDAFLKKSEPFNNFASARCTLHRGDARTAVNDMERVLASYDELEDWYLTQLALAGMEVPEDDPVIAELRQRQRLGRMIVECGAWFTDNHLPEGDKVDAADSDEDEFAWIAEHLKARRDPPAPTPAKTSTTSSVESLQPRDAAESAERTEGAEPSEPGGPVIPTIPDTPATATSVLARTHFAAKLERAKKLKAAGDEAWASVASSIGDDARLAAIADARRHYLDTVKILQDAHPSDEAEDTLRAELLDRACESALAMRLFQLDPVHSLKVTAPTAFALKQLKKEKAITIGWPGDRSAIQPDSQGWFIEVELKPAPVLGQQPVSWFAHLHLKSGQDPRKENWTLKAARVGRAHVKLDHSRKLGNAEIRAKEDASSVVFRRGLDPAWIVDWVNELGKPTREDPRQ
jgi:hypothetical protein